MAPRIQKLYHIAYACYDAEQTRAFYEDVLEMPLVNCMGGDHVPSTGEKMDYLHFFMELGDGSYVAFFDTKMDAPPEPSPNTPGWVQHLALEVDRPEDVREWSERLRRAGVETTEIVDHGFIESIYFNDPNGHRLEITARTEGLEFLQRVRREARPALDAWNLSKVGS